MVATAAISFLWIGGTAQAAACAELGPDGYQTLKLGMTTQQAKATGEIVPYRGPDPGAGINPECGFYDLTDRPGRPGGLTVLVSPKLGVSYIEGYPGVRTPQGIGIGSTEEALRTAYPDWNPAEPGGQFVPVPENPNAFYEFNAGNGEVDHLGLRSVGQECIE
ncbi:hypothetical protein [Amycolatopsis cihanbeyliensis]|uniref:hypothetical protein n=1 Tax=Amycolatopsis cihanbeyliensis TaxID=1128664 RepID=UPI001B875042|nr:hypothetical protein [Amycolatopsis cihanbeyliensis]